MTDVRIWRYMSFGRFVWLLKKKALWLSRVDRLEDHWEMAFSEDEIEHMLSEVPHQNADAKRAARKALLKTVHESRKWYFVNSWTASPSESHAMWSVYARSSEGVAIQTTLRELKASASAIQDCHVHQISYKRFRHKPGAMTPLQLATRKKPEFAYEREHRIVLRRMPSPPNSLASLGGFGRPEGFELPWEPEKTVIQVLLHPAADSGFRLAVEAVVEQFAPSLRSCLKASGMAALPPR